MARYAAGKKSKALCDRCGLKYDYDQLKEQVVNRRPNGLRVCPSCLDVDHPQRRVGEARFRTRKLSGILARTVWSQPVTWWPLVSDIRTRRVSMSSA